MGGGLADELREVVPGIVGSMTEGPKAFIETLTTRQSRVQTLAQWKGVGAT